MSDKPKFDPSTWGQKPKEVPPKKEEPKKSKKEKVDSEEEESKSSKKDKKNTNIEIEEKFKQLTDQITQLKKELDDSKVSPKKLIEKSELEAFIQANGNDAMKHWLFGNQSISHPKGGTRKSELQFLLNMINHFLFKE